MQQSILNERLKMLALKIQNDIEFAWVQSFLSLNLYFHIPLIVDYQRPVSSSINIQNLYTDYLLLNTIYWAVKFPMSDFFIKPCVTTNQTTGGQKDSCSCMGLEMIDFI